MKNMILDFLSQQKAKGDSKASSISGNDRLMRGILGGALIVWGLSAKKGGRLRTLAGASLVAGSVMGTNNSVLGMIKSFMPGPGINPRETDQASPQQRKTGSHNLSLDTLKEMLSVG